MVRNGNIVGPCKDVRAAQQCGMCILDTSVYFASLSLGAKLAVQEVLSFRRFNRRDIIYTEGSPNKFLYILISGEVKLYKSLSQGRQQTHKLVSIPGDLIGCEDFFLDTHFSAAETIEDSIMCAARRDALLRVIGQDAEVSKTLMHAMARTLHFYIRHISNLGQKRSVERVASYLVLLSQTHQARNLHNDLVARSLTRLELADMLGITQRTLIRSLKELEDASLISRARGGFAILDLDALVEISDGH